VNRAFEQKLDQKSKEVSRLKEANKRLEDLCVNKQLKERVQLQLELQEPIR
jgi:hypothetical protein